MVAKLPDLLFRRKLLNKKVCEVESSKAKTPIKPAYKAELNFRLTS